MLWLRLDVSGMCLYETGSTDRRNTLVSILLPCMGDVVAGFDCYSFRWGSEADAKGLQATINTEANITGTSHWITNL